MDGRATTRAGANSQLLAQVEAFDGYIPWWAPAVDQIALDDGKRWSAAFQSEDDHFTADTHHVEFARSRRYRPTIRLFSTSNTPVTSRARTSAI